MAILKLHMLPPFKAEHIQVLQAAECNKLMELHMHTHVPVEKEPNHAKPTLQEL